MLTVWKALISNSEENRLEQVLTRALDGLSVSYTDEFPIKGKLILFAVQLDDAGQNENVYRLIGTLRRRPDCLKGCLAGIVVDGPDELYTKQVARSVALAANMAGCAFLGRPLVEATGSLQNFSVQAQLGEFGLQDAYEAAVRELAGRLLAEDVPALKPNPNLLVLHAGIRATSNTLALWQMVKKHLNGFDISEIGLRNGTLEDCAGCPYKTCLHFGEEGNCFYGGVLVKEVYPAIQKADGIVMLCPNYNDAVSANHAAFINRLTALFRTRRFYDKAVFGIVVSGYSGGDIVASQLVSAMNMNKSFFLPPHFCMLETANDAGAIFKVPEINRRAEAFAKDITNSLQSS